MFMRYLDHTGIVDEPAQAIKGHQANKKGLSVNDLVRQTLGFFTDGNHSRLTHFDLLKDDLGYQGVMETPAERLASSHQVKRFFNKFTKVSSSAFRRVLRDMAISRMKREQLPVIELFLDTMVMNNDDAAKREGVTPTYKKVCGFQPLQLIWDGQIVDAQFRGGKKNGNHGHTAFAMIKKAVKAIRKHVNPKVPVVVRMDGGFFDGKLFWRLDVSNIGFVCAGRRSEENKKLVAELDSESAKIWRQKKQAWQYQEYTTTCKSWDRSYRGIHLKKIVENNQQVFEFATKDNHIITNLGFESRVLNQLTDDARKKYEEAEYLVANFFARGCDELTHRRFKEFGFEALPFKRFAANAAMYYLMVIGYNLMEFFKRDVLGDRVAKRAYPTTIRRRYIDFAAKVVRTAGCVILKVSESVMNRLNLNTLWLRCEDVPPVFL